MRFYWFYQNYIHYLQCSKSKSAELKLQPHFTECKYKQHNQPLPQKAYRSVQRQSAKHDNSNPPRANLKPSRKARKNSSPTKNYFEKSQVRNLGRSHSRRVPLLQGWLGVMQVRLGACVLVVHCLCARGQGGPSYRRHRQPPRAP